MKRFHAICPTSKEDLNFSFTVEGREGSERIGEFTPPGLRELLSGQALLASKKYRMMILGRMEEANLLKPKAYVTHLEDERR